MRFFFTFEWGQVTPWPVVWCGVGECDCCDEQVFAVGLQFLGWNVGVEFGG